MPDPYSDVPATDPSYQTTSRLYWSAVLRLRGHAQHLARRPVRQPDHAVGGGGSNPMPAHHANPHPGSAGAAGTSGPQPIVAQRGSGGPVSAMLWFTIGGFWGWARSFAR
jgi:hypothetical protein